MKFERTYPKYELTLPSTNKKIYFRPFLVSDEKNLLLIKEEKNAFSINTNSEYLEAKKIMTKCKIRSLY